MTKKILKTILYALSLVSIILFAIFVILSLYYRVENLLISISCISVFTLSLITIIIFFRRLIAWVFYLVIVALWLLWYSSIEASNNRIWQKDVAVLAYVTHKDNLYRVHNIRNFTYTTEFDYKPSYYDETFDIDKLNGIDFIASYWMGEDIAHTFLSFSFSDDKHLAISIEARKELDESYSMIRGFFKDSELYYVVADERDLIGLRTNIRKNPPEQVYMYQINAPLKDMKKVFLSYLTKLNELKNRPEFYNTLTTNCTTSIWNNSLINYSKLKFNWEILVSGHTAHYLYENGLLQSYGLSFKELQKRSFINPLVDANPIDKSFSFKIR